MEKINTSTPDLTQENIAKLAEIFPDVVTESVDSEGKLSLSVDFDALQEDLSVDTCLSSYPKERYQFTWPGKREAKLEARRSINKTLKPCPEKSVNWDTTENIYIEGDNLDALKIMRETYMHKVNAIYIDPPYNTGRNLIYRNNFYESQSSFKEKSGDWDDYGNMLIENTKTNGRFHSDWCSMIYSRLLLARDFLCDDGVIVLTIDDSEIETITFIMNEIFGEDSHLATIVIKNNPSGRSTVTGAAIAHEYALIYGKNPSVKLGRLPRNEKQISRYKEVDDISRFEWVNFRKHGGFKEDAPSMYYPIFISEKEMDFRIPDMSWDSVTSEWKLNEQPLTGEFIAYPIDDQARERRWKWGVERALNNKSEMKVRLDKNNIPAIYIKSRMNNEGMLPLTVWDDTKYSSTEYGTNLLKDLFGEKFFDYPKSIHAVEDCIRIATEKKDALLLDFFSGSATTAHAVMNLNAEDDGNRRFICVQVPEHIEEESSAYKAGYRTICDVGEERIRKSGAQFTADIDDENMTLDLEGISNSIPDIGFKVFSISESNIESNQEAPNEYQQDFLEKLYSNNLRNGAKNIDLLYEILPKFRIDYTANVEIETLCDKEVFLVNDNQLIACFDINITNDVIQAITKFQPLYAVFRDASFVNEAARTNLEEIFKIYSPDTQLRVI